MPRARRRAEDAPKDFSCRHAFGTIAHFSLLTRATLFNHITLWISDLRTGIESGVCQAANAISRHANSLLQAYYLTPRKTKSISRLQIPPHNRLPCLHENQTGAMGVIFALINRHSIHDISKPLMPRPFAQARQLYGMRRSKRHVLPIPLTSQWASLDMTQARRERAGYVICTARRLRTIRSQEAAQAWTTISWRTMGEVLRLL